MTVDHLRGLLGPGVLYMIRPRHVALQAILFCYPHHHIDAGIHISEQAIS